jgi:hypothetical protein
LIIESDKKIRADGILVRSNKLKVDETLFLKEILEKNPKADEIMSEFYKKFDADEKNKGHPIGNKLKNKLKALRYLGVNSEVPKCAYNFAFGKSVQ